MVEKRLDAKWSSIWIPNSPNISILDKWTPSCFITYWSGFQMVGLVRRTNTDHSATRAGFWIPDYFNLLLERWSEWQTICQLFSCLVSNGNRAFEEWTSKVRYSDVSVIQIFTVHSLPKNLHKFASYFSGLAQTRRLSFECYRSSEARTIIPH